MGATRKYAVIDLATGKIDRRILSAQTVYDDEMEKIFGRAWLMIGHESLVPEPDDFFHTYMGEDPVILTRDGQGRLHALLVGTQQADVALALLGEVTSGSGRRPRGWRIRCGRREHA